ncbi:hypothetical protein N431DRAFT_495713 [Stipitochalara longipes BDJ]|nr:hypothetical protein N431DRAFT_495713 [Stipitochalara longipes BDJ]
MSTTAAAQPDGLASSSSRTPLKTISPPIQKQVRRRKSSFVLRGDSSEDCPSSHDSIFEAYCFSAANSEESGHKIDSNSTSPQQHGSSGGANEHSRVDENHKQLIAPAGTLSVPDVEFRYGWGTILETITEQKSSNTMRTLAGTRSADDSPKFPFLKHCDSFEVSKSPRRKQSFSVNDLNLAQQNYHEACAMIERETRKPLPVHEIYAQPKDPIHPPICRPPTPPGMPSWTAAQNVPRSARGSNNTSGTQNRLQRIFNLPASGSSSPSHIPTRSVSAPLPNRIAPRFRPPRSVYGPIDRHPFATAPIAKVIQMSPSEPIPALTSSGIRIETRLPKLTGKRKLGKRVRFTPSATARDSEMVSLQTAITTTSSAAMHPLAPVHITSDVAHAIPTPFCPHRKGRQSALKLLRNSINYDSTTAPLGEYLLLSDQSPPRSSSTLALQRLTPILLSTDSTLLPTPRQASSSTAHSTLFDSQQLSRATSFSSAAHLMTGAHGSPSPTPSSLSRNDLSATSAKTPWCWKCSIEKGVHKIDYWWMQSAGCMCMLCFGVDADDDMSIYRSSSGAHDSHRESLFAIILE